MKWETPDHQKTTYLAGLLSIEIPTAVGLLVLLWRWVSKYQPTGSLEGVPDFSIAAACRWRGDASQLVSAFHTAGWLDAQPFQRVHDWSDHAEDWVHRVLADQGKLFADGRMPNVGKLFSGDRKEALRRLELARAEWEAAAAQETGAPVSKETPRSFQGGSVEPPRSAVAVAIARDLSTTAPPTPADQRPLNGLIGLVPRARSSPEASVETVARLRGQIELLMAVTGEGSFEYWCREVTSRKLGKKRGDYSRDYSQARIGLDGISEACAQRSILDSRAEVGRMMLRYNLCDDDVARIAAQLRERSA